MTRRKLTEIQLSMLLSAEALYDADHYSASDAAEAQREILGPDFHVICGHWGPDTILRLLERAGRA